MEFNDSEESNDFSGFQIFKMRCIEVKYRVRGRLCKLDFHAFLILLWNVTWYTHNQLRKHTNQALYNSILKSSMPIKT